MDKKSVKHTVEAKWTEIDRIIRVDLSLFKELDTGHVIFSIEGKMFIVTLVDEPRPPDPF